MQFEQRMCEYECVLNCLYLAAAAVSTLCNLCDEDMNRLYIYAMPRQYIQFIYTYLYASYTCSIACHATTIETHTLSHIHTHKANHSTNN